nr:recombinase family protein [Paenibacillus typhae]
MSNQVYLGRRVWNRKRSADDLIVTEDAHPPIIDMELWNAAQASLLIRRQSN